MLEFILHFNDQFSFCILQTYFCNMVNKNEYRLKENTIYCNLVNKEYCYSFSSMIDYNGYLNEFKHFIAKNKLAIDDE
jgi:hypothetical protein